MGQYGRMPDPFDALRQQTPRTGLPVTNQGGTPSMPPTPAVKTVIPSPALRSGNPGPTSPGQPPISLPPGPPGYTPGAELGSPGGNSAPAPAMQQVKETKTTTSPANSQPLPAGPQPAPTGGPYRLVGSRPTMPEWQELEALGRGHGMTTPHGDIYRDQNGALQLQLNDEGKAAYEQERARIVQSYGAYPGHDDPAAPPPPITPGMPHFNPYTGQWTE